MGWRRSGRRPRRFGHPRDLVGHAVGQFDTEGSLGHDAERALREFDHRRTLGR
jgi:hypothetical protein